MSDTTAAIGSGFITWMQAKEAEVMQFAESFGTELINDAEIALDDLIGIAGQAVLNEAPKIISGSEKFGEAVAHVIQTVEANGKTVLVATAQSAVQQAVLAAQTVANAAKTKP